MWCIVPSQSACMRCIAHPALRLLQSPMSISRFVPLNLECQATDYCMHCDNPYAVHVCTYIYFCRLLVYYSLLFQHRIQGHALTTVILLLCTHTYIRSRLYRTIKLFFIGSGERGKTTLLRRLQGISIDKLKRLDHDRTIGIDVVDWTYTASTPLFRSKPEPVHFLAWDFAGQVSINSSR